MKCPNCSAECADQSRECDFCGHSFVEASGAIEQGVPAEPIAPPAPPVADVPPPFVASSAPAVPPANPYANTSEAKPQHEVPNHLIWAIVATVIGTLVNFVACCCLPVTLATGITAIVYALKVNKFLETGEISSAEQAAKNAKIWSWATTILGILFALWFIATLVLQIGDPEFLENIRKQVEASR